VSAERVRAAPAVAAVREALAGEAEVWIVGGAIRDALLDRSVRDVDVAVRGDAESVARRVARAFGGPLFPLSETFGAWRAVDRARRWVCDVAPVHGDRIEDDLAQRDFTVNAMALALQSGDLIDPHGGRSDLEAGVLRVLGEHAYLSDPLRPLRLVRLATELSLRPDGQTESLTRSHAPALGRASPERLFGEVRRLMIADRAVEGLELADRLGLIRAILPEVDALHGVEQSHFHHLDVYGHTLEVVRRQIGLERELDELFGETAGAVGAVLTEPLGDELTHAQGLRLGALLHDVGKPGTRAIREDGRVTFLGHDALGVEMVTAICRRLRMSERVRSLIAGVTRHHLALGFLVAHRPLPARLAYRYLHDCRPVEVEVTLLSCADRLATRGRSADAAITAHLELARELMPEALRWRAEGPPRAPVRGDRLADALGIERGPELGRLLERLAEARFVGEIADEAGAIELARRLRDNPQA
jgi:putative nucleotidyltransferase with HDIG domain